MTELAISSAALSKSYGKGPKAVHALRDFSLSVERGNIFSLLGPNGAGKTTFIKCMLGIVFPTGGNGRMLGEPFASTNAKKRIGYLPENHRYPPHLTGGQVLTYFGKLSGVDDSDLKARIPEL